MSGAGHTPGPWSVLGPHVVAQVPIDTGRTVSVVASVANSSQQLRFACAPADLENHANARLIAAAPDMLEALHMAWKFIALHSPGNPYATEPGISVAAAIAKAEGR